MKRILLMFVLLVVALFVIAAIAAAQETQEERQTGYYVLDGFGGIHAGNGAPALYGLPYWGDDVFEEIEIIKVRCDGEQVYYVKAIVLDALGGVWEVTSDPNSPLLLWTTNQLPFKPYMNAQTRADGDETPFFYFDIARDVEPLINPFKVWDRSCWGGDK